MRERIRGIVRAYEPARLGGEGLAPAAVLLLLHERGGAEHLLFQVRTHLVEHHKGEISFPGGARDPGDASLEATCLRETEEEIGVAPADVEIYGRLDDVPTRSRFAMSPCVGAITRPGPYPFRLAGREVAELLAAPLDWLRSGEAREWTARPGAPPAPAFRCGGRLIFGATARVVDRFLRLIGDGGDGR